MRFWELPAQQSPLLLCGASKMQTSQNGIDLIKNFESCELRTYKCAAGKNSIGYGHTKGVVPGMSITYEQAEQFLRDDLADVERDISRLKLNLTQCQFDALASFVFNLGIGNLLSSTLLKKLKQGDNTGAMRQFTAWIYVTHSVKLNDDRKVMIREPLRGLCARRMSEQAMFNGEIKLFSFNNQYVNETVIAALHSQIAKTTDSAIKDYYCEKIRQYS